MQADLEKKDDGGPIHPYESYDEVADMDTIKTGMSLRDWFAGQALAGYCAEESGWDQPPEEIARCAYRIADAMLKARNDQ